MLCACMQAVEAYDMLQKPSFSEADSELVVGRALLEYHDPNNTAAGQVGASAPQGSF